MTKKLLVWLQGVDAEDKELYGEKGVRLGELAALGFPTIPGFVITSLAYHQFIKDNNLEIKIRHILGLVDFTNPRSLDKAASSIKKEFEKGVLSELFVKQLFQGYLSFDGQLKNPLVTLYPCVTSQSGTTHSLLEPIPFVSGEANLIYALKESWASLFSPTALSERHNAHEDHFQYGVATTLTKTPMPDISVITYTQNLPNQDKSLVVVKAMYGIWTKNPYDHYEVKKKSLVITRKEIANQKTMHVNDEDSEKDITIPLHKQNVQKLSEKHIKEMALLSTKIEHHFYFPQEVHCSLENNSLIITECKSLSPTFSKQDFPIMHAPTATRVYVTLADPQLAPQLAKEFVDGVGLVQSEYLLRKVGIHPKKLIQEEKTHLLEDMLVDGLATIARAFSPRPVIYRLSHLTSHDYKTLVGGQRLESQEKNPFLGYRGAYRLLQEKDAIKIELDAIEKVRNQMGMRNIWLMIPFVRTTSELFAIKKHITAANLYRSSSFKIWIGCSVPSVAITIETFCKAGIDGVFIDEQELTSLLLGIDRENPELSLTFTSHDESVSWAIERIIRICRENTIATSLFSPTIGAHPALLESAIQWGLDSITVAPQIAPVVREQISQIERKLVTTS